MVAVDPRRCYARDVSDGSPEPLAEFDEDNRVRADSEPPTSLVEVAPSMPPLPQSGTFGRDDSPVLGRTATARAVSPRMTAVFGGVFGLATVASVFALLIQVFPVKDQRGKMVTVPSAEPEENAPEAPQPSKRASLKRVRQELPQPWRVDDLKATHQLLKGDMQRRSLSG